MAMRLLQNNTAAPEDGTGFGLILSVAAAAILVVVFVVVARRM